MRHAGWVASALVAALVVTCTKLKQSRITPATSNDDNNRRWSVATAACVAAAATALEAVATDLLVFLPAGAAGATTTTTLFCGNFGRVALLPDSVVFCDLYVPY